ncbi:ferredoxin-NADP reductase [Luteimonas cucumeris]|uniref:Ferredoxin-NADP reductase n=1 Tax=Luteimonas cucumeris TaxID=985012 RepID=A0A562L7B1_9GAMM|nr:ferredoxin reductase [Luteimonas cucumeris]TWI03518.1 ferredoxin-NADP reductase [Luteimonas cucumeris]
MNAVLRPVPDRRLHPVKRLLKPLVAPAVFDFWASRVDRTWTWERPLARLVGREPAARDAVTLVLKPNRHWHGFQPGQHLNLGAEIDGARITRSYSLVDLPRADGRIAITVKAIEGGKLSQHLCHVAKPGDVFELGPAFGDMTLPAQPQGPLLLLAAGSGITPLMALTRALAAQGMPVPLTLLYWARSRDEFCFLDELRALAARHPNFRLSLLLTREPAQAADEHVGRIDEALLSSLVYGIAAQQVLACGPGGFVETARTLLADRVVSFQAEAFSPQPVAITDTGTVQVRLARRGRTLQVPRGQSLLSALEAEGIKPAAGCRMGICNTCACGKRAGGTRHLPTGELTHEPMSALKLCINSAVTDLELDL